MADVTNDNERTPRWVKVFGIIALLVVLLFVIMFLTRGRHGPGRHMRGGGSATSSTLVTDCTSQPS